MEHLAYLGLLWAYLVSAQPDSAANLCPSDKLRIFIFVTLFIYVRAGRTIYQKRKELNNVASNSGSHSANGEGRGATKRTEVVVTTTDASQREGDSASPSQSATRPDFDEQREGYIVTVAAGSRYSSAGPSQFPKAQASPPHPAKDASTPRPTPNLTRSNFEVSNAAWAYTKCAILFFTALLITWIPSSANRVYSFVHPDTTLPPLEFMSAFVLPLQGFWNAIIYIVTSWSACRDLWYDLRQGRRPGVKELIVGMRSRDDHYPEGSQRSWFRSSHPLRKGDESESMTELANFERSQ